MDRESRAWHEVIVEARDQDGGATGRSKRVKVKVAVTDVNDNAPVIVDPQQDVVAVREQQQPGVEVVTVKATDPDQGSNGTLTYSVLKGTDKTLHNDCSNLGKTACDSTTRRSSNLYH